MSVRPSPVAREDFATVTTPDGTRIAYVDEGGEGVPILFSNSLASDWRMWNGVCERLGTARRIRYDSRGHGRSQLPQGACDAATAGSDALAVLDACGVERALVCGLSLGGVVGMWLAANAPQRIAGLVLANTAVTFAPASMWWQRAETAEKEGMTPLVDASIQRWFTPSFHEANPAVVDDMKSMIAAMPPAGYAASCGLLAGVDMQPQLSAITCPVLVIAGAHDPSTPPARALEIVEGIAGAKLLELDAAHMSAVEQPEAFANALLDFRGSLET